MNEISESGGSLLEYLEHVRRLETACYQLDRLKEEAKREKGQLPKQPKPPEPVSESRPEPVKLKKTILKDDQLVLWGKEITVFAVVIFFVLFLLLHFIFKLTFGDYLSFMWIVVLLAVVVGLVEKHREKYNRDQRFQQEYYDNEVQHFKDDTAKYEKELAEYKQSHSIMDRTLNDLGRCRAETKQLLDKFYDQNIIYQKYRGLVPVCTFCEYLESGRCEELAGHEGAYNIYEEELRMNIIIGKLNDVIDRLDQIRQNQRVLAEAIVQTNSMIKSMSGQMATLKAETEMNTYYSKRAAQNTEYVAWLETWRMYSE